MPGRIRTGGGDAGLFDHPVDIGVSMSADVLEHKRRDGRKSAGRYCFWSMARVPDGVRAGSKLWVACMGSWVGCFEIHAKIPGQVWFRSETWRPASMRIMARPRPPFRGFTYKVPGAS